LGEGVIIEPMAIVDVTHVLARLNFGLNCPLIVSFCHSDVLHLGVRTGEDGAVWDCDEASKHLCGAEIAVNELNRFDITGKVGLVRWSGIVEFKQKSL
jgi:hypothetical protein